MLSLLQVLARKQAHALAGVTGPAALGTSGAQRGADEQPAAGEVVSNLLVAAVLPN